MTSSPQLDINDDSKQIVFYSIGNPGPITRHSVGHLALHEMIGSFRAKSLVKKSSYSITLFENLTFVKSNSYMNESNKLLKSFLEQECIRLSQIILVILYDDFELPIPKVKISTLKKNESHNGIKSLQKILSSQSSLSTIFKLGIGIGPKPSNPSKDTMSSWVLANFKQVEKENLMENAMSMMFGYVSHIIESNGDIKDCNKLNAKMTKVYKS